MKYVIFLPTSDCYVGRCGVCFTYARPTLSYYKVKLDRARVFDTKEEAQRIQYQIGEKTLIKEQK